jgi:hypothetical protein
MSLSDELDCLSHKKIPGVHLRKALTLILRVLVAVRAALV